MVTPLPLLSCSKAHHYQLLNRTHSCNAVQAVSDLQNAISARQRRGITAAAVRCGRCISCRESVLCTVAKCCLSKLLLYRYTKQEALAPVRSTD
jgi:hypothetical protein